MDLYRQQIIANQYAYILCIFRSFCEKMFQHLSQLTGVVRFADYPRNIIAPYQCSDFGITVTAGNDDTSLLHLNLHYQY